MRTFPPEITTALAGSRTGEGLLVRVWRDGLLAVDDLPVSQWQLSEDKGRQVAAQFTATVADPDGRLVPVSWGDVLAPGGSRLQVLYRSGGFEAALGWYVVTRVAPDESWSVIDGRWVSGGASITVEADDLTALLASDRLLAPDSAPAGATVASEIRRLVGAVLPVWFDPGVNTGRTVSSSTVYERERLDALDDLAALVGARLAVDGEGTLTIVNRAGEPVHDIRGGADGTLISVSRNMAAGEVYNAVVSTSSAGSAGEFVGYAYLATGPLAWDGPAGRRPYFHSSPLINSQAAADADAASTLARLQASAAVELEITMLPNPALQAGDRVRVAVPVAATDQNIPAWLDGVIENLTLSGDISGPHPQRLTVAVSGDQWAKVVAHV